VSELPWGATIEPSPVRVTICTVCGKLWGDHQDMALANWWKEQGNGYFTEEAEPPVEELPITLEYCVALLVKANQGPQGPTGPMGPKGDKGDRPVD